MKVLLINSEHALKGGAHTVYLNIANMLRSKGHDVAFFAMHSTGELPYINSAFFAESRKKKRAFQYILKAFYNSDAANQLQKLIEHEKPDIAHIHLFWGSLSPSILDVLKNNAIPIVHTVHDYSMVCPHITMRSTKGSGFVCDKCKNGNYIQCARTRCYNGDFIRSLVASTEMLYRNRFHHPVDYIDHFNFVSEFCANKHREMDRKFNEMSLSVIHNVPDVLVEAMADNISFNTYDSYYLYYGRLAYEKGIDTLIDAFIENPQLNLKIVGTGPMENYLKAKCKDNTGNINFQGYKSGNELYELVRNAKYVCVPSEWYENCPMTIIEAFSLGTPVIGARIGGIPELITENENGFLFESGNLSSLKESINASIKLTSAQYYTMKNKSRLTALNRFDRNTYIDSIIAIYKQTILTYNHNQ